MEQSLVDWLKERRENCLRLSATKTGEDKQGWLDDAYYFACAIDAASRLEQPVKQEATIGEAVSDVQREEMCCICDELTGRAGKGDDSLYTDTGKGPFCQQCFDVQRVKEAREQAKLAKEFVELNYGAKEQLGEEDYLERVGSAFLAIKFVAERPSQDSVKVEKPLGVLVSEREMEALVAAPPAPTVEGRGAQELKLEGFTYYRYIRGALVTKSDDPLCRDLVAYQDFCVVVEQLREALGRLGRVKGHLIYFFGQRSHAKLSTGAMRILDAVLELVKDCEVPASEQGKTEGQKRALNLNADNGQLTDLVGRLGRGLEAARNVLQQCVDTGFLQPRLINEARIALRSTGEQGKEEGQPASTITVAEHRRLTEQISLLNRQSRKALDERDAALSQVKHYEDQQRNMVSPFSEKLVWPDDWLKLSDKDLCEATEYADKCKCFVCQWVRYELTRRDQMIRICEQRDAALAAAEWKPITAETLPTVGSEVLNPNDFALVTGVLKSDISPELWIALGGFTHYRPINPPSQVSGKEQS